MTIAFIIAAVLALAFLVLWLTVQQKARGLQDELEETDTQLAAAKSEIAAMNDQIDRVKDDLQTLEAKAKGLDSELIVTRSRLADAADTLRKRTELADAQALQIDALSGERDDLRQKLAAAEERIVTLNARPGVVVGAVDAAIEDAGADSADHFAMLWDLEVARSERLWRTSVAIDPSVEISPFADTDDPTRKAVEIEAAALREDVGALITIDWQAPPIDSAARRLLVVRVAQELLATAARAPGATRLLVSHKPDEATTGGGDEADTVDAGGELIMEFVSPDNGSDAVNLIPPQISSDLVDVRDEAGLSVTVRSRATVGAAVGDSGDGD